MRERLIIFFHRAIAPFRRRHLEADLDAELASHVAMTVEFNLRKGMSAAEARREALRTFGGFGAGKKLLSPKYGCM